ncbi:MAG TPA: helix-turn-helix transcriptional regulator [Spirochaetota bacterium]|nr:helix-turn-helix transcriptional regulator [Spirochaetota bacterium]HPI88776.1 helix-turn-helix transcriptional regulator [Spirochaetota bacterium]HPR47149.1 helix-turn-helix transcriptional regulator [Spirochaetota bacterium]
MFNKFISSISSDLEDEEYPRRILHEYYNFFHLKRAHLAGLDQNLNTHFYERIGFQKFEELYLTYEDYDTFKPGYMPVPLQAVPVHVDSKEMTQLNDINQLYQSFEGEFTCIIGSIHPTLYGIIGLSDSEDYSAEELRQHQIISPMIVNSYYQHTKIIQSRDMTRFLGDEFFSNRLCAVVDEQCSVLYSHREFMTELRLRGLEWNTLVNMVRLFKRPHLINIHGLKERVTLPLESSSSAVTLEPVVSGGTLFLVIEIHDRGNLPSITPREREIYLLIRQGCANRNIAHALNISSETVKRHLSNLFLKAGVKNRTELSHLVL